MEWRPVRGFEGATALSTLQTENEKLRADSVRLNDLLASYQNVLVPELRSELEQVKAKRDAAVPLVHEWEQYGRYLSPMGFTVPPNWRED